MLLLLSIHLLLMMMKQVCRHYLDHWVRVGSSRVACGNRRDEERVLAVDCMHGLVEIGGLSGDGNNSMVGFHFLEVLQLAAFNLILLGNDLGPVVSLFAQAAHAGGQEARGDERA